MRIRIIAAAVTAVLFLAFIFAANSEDAPSFSIDQEQVLQGMKRSWLQGYVPEIRNSTLTMVIPVRSDSARGIIQAELIPDNQAKSVFQQQNMSVNVQQENRIWPVRFSLKLFDDRQNGDYLCTIRIYGKDENGTLLQTDIPYMLKIRDGQPNTETARIIISDIQSDLSVGEEGEIRLTVSNPCETVAFEHPVIRIRENSGNIVPKESNTLYLKDLAPGEETSIVFPVTVDPKASVSPHSITFEMTWSVLGMEKNQTEQHTVPVQQEIRLEQGGLKMASSVIAGDSVTAALPLMNMGKADIINVMATISVPGITDRQSVLVGTISPGETKQAQLTLTTGKSMSGDYTGTLTVEGTDNSGNKTSFSLPIDLAVEEPPVKQEAAQEEETAAAKESRLIVYVLGGGCGLLLILLILQSVILRRKIHRLEEDKL